MDFLKKKSIFVTIFCVLVFSAWLKISEDKVHQVRVSCTHIHRQTEVSILGP